MTRRAPLAAGAAVLCLLVPALALAWPARSPLTPRLGGHLAGDRTYAWVFVALLAAAFIAYACGLALVARGAPRMAAVVALAAAIQLAPLGAPLLLSSDAWSYWAYGRIAAVHGGNPYRVPPDERFPHDPAVQRMGANWRDTTSVYGPAFTLASEPIARAAGRSEDAAAWIYKTLAAAAALAAAALAARVSRRPVFALAFVGWNPVLAVHLGGGGHNDALVGALVVAALAAAASGRRRLAGVAWALGALVKWIPLVLLPLRALEARATGRRVDHLGLGLTTLAVAALATWRYGLDWLSALGPLTRNADKETRFALPHRLGQLGVPHPLAIALFAVAFAVAYAWLAREALRGRARLGLCAALLLLATPYLAVWYLAWAVPLAAADDDRAAQWLTLGLGAYLLRQAIPL